MPIYLTYTLTVLYSFIYLSRKYYHFMFTVEC